jgi:hypothetical protein
VKKKMVKSKREGEYYLWRENSSVIFIYENLNSLRKGLCSNESRKVFTVYPSEVSESWNYVSEDEVKCGNCNRKTSRLFVIAKNRKEAIKNVKEGKDGVCGECLADRISHLGFELKVSESQ